VEISGSGAVVFGGGSGLGASAARALASRGADVLVADRDGSRATEVAEEVGGVPVAADVTSVPQVEAAIGEAAGFSGGLRILVNCAGIGVGTKVLSRDGPTALEVFEEVIQVNLVGTINTLRLGAAAMSANDPDDANGERGVCINTSSIAAYDGQVGQVAYAASKGGVAAMTLPAARELAQFGIRVLGIAPGPFETPMVNGMPERMRSSFREGVVFPRRLGMPSEYASLVTHVVENPMINGDVIRIDGAVRLGPG
jgi:NAD(P)-dependent dehydrogenase (short-subunit alcohol dehydrogenase family)